MKQQREGLTRRVLSAWTLLHVEPAEVLPAPLRARRWLFLRHTQKALARIPVSLYIEVMSGA